MDIKKFIKLWERFEEETKEFRRIKHDLSVSEKPEYFKGDFYDFMMWLRSQPEELLS